MVLSVFVDKLKMSRSTIECAAEDTSQPSDTSKRLACSVRRDPVRRGCSHSQRSYTRLKHWCAKERRDLVVKGPNTGDNIKIDSGLVARVLIGG